MPDRDSLSDLTDCERLVDFWHTQDFGKLLDDAANDVLLALQVRAERDRLRSEVEALARHDPLTCELCHAEGVGAELVSLRAEVERLRHGYCDEAYILMVQALDVKALAKGRRRILTEQAVRMAKVGLSKGWPRYQMRDVERRAEDVLRAHAPEEIAVSFDEQRLANEDQ